MTAPDDTHPRPGPHAVEVRELTKAHDGRTVVDDVSFTVEEGETFAILGPNGAGKTTTVESIAGLRTPDAGSVRVCGHDPVAERAASATCSACSCRRAASRTS